MEVIAAAMMAYSLVTVIIVIMACIVYSDGDLDCPPLAYVFWPFIALNAALIKLRDMWH